MINYFLFGLGNPGKRHLNTRHNAGYKFISYFFRTCEFKPKGFNFLFAQKEFFIGILPLIFMNENGKIIVDLKNFSSFDLKNLIIFLDDLNLPFGAIRFRKKGSDGGHKGLRSCIYYAQTDEIMRLRIGIGFNYDIPAEIYVLQEFSEDELFFLEKKVFPYIEEGIEKFLKEGMIDKFENYINNFNREGLKPRQKE
ncbi:MAG: aminoacyl-tRNA hydrolase [Candidatus Hydrothermales bacterium]